MHFVLLTENNREDHDEAGVAVSAHGQRDLEMYLMSELAERYCNLSELSGPG